MAYAAWVTSRPHPQRRSTICLPAEPGEHIAVVVLIELSQLIKANHLELRGLVSVLISNVFQVAEGERGAAWEGPGLGSLTPLSVSRHQPLLGSIDQGAGKCQVGVGPA